MTPRTGSASLAPAARPPRCANARIATLAAAAALALCATAPLHAQKVGTIVVAHGGDSLWNAQVRDVVGQARTGGPLEVSFLMGAGAVTTRFQDAVARLERAGVERIVIVRLLVSSSSGHYEQIRYLAGEAVTLDADMTHHLHMSGIARPATNLPLHLVKALDASHEMARVLADRATALAASLQASPRDRALMIVGHGPNSAEDYASWMEHLRPVADSVRAWTGFRDVRVDLVRDDAPVPVRAEAVRRVRELIELQSLVTGQDVLVVPVLVSKGTVSRDKVPADIRGTRSIYQAEPLLPHPAMSRWIESRVRAATAAFAGVPR